MLWWQHIFALLVLAHLAWAASRLQKEWQRAQTTAAASLHPAMETFAELDVEGVPTQAKIGI